MSRSVVICACNRNGHIHFNRTTTVRRERAIREGNGSRTCNRGKGRRTAACCGRARVGATVIAPGAVGRVSVKFNPLTVTEVGFVNVKVNAETPPALVGSGLKFFAMVTAEAGSMMYAKRVEIP